MKLFPFILALVGILTSCQASSQSQPPTATSMLTSTSSPIPTLTNTPEPTSTSEPSPTPIILPDSLHQIFSGVSVIYRDSFEYVMQGLAPQGWQTDEQYAIWITEENQLKAKPMDSSFGTVFYYSDDIITENKGVFFTFKFTGSTENFTLGFDNVLSNGERVTGANFHSVAMELRNSNILVHAIQKKSQISGAMRGNLRLQEDTWYNIALAFDENNNFIIKIWQPDNPETQVTYLRNWADFPHQYYFISWISSKRALLIDDFTVFEFDEITQK